jgi:WS/DGAT/MGAT family acyltransferase
MPVTAVRDALSARAEGEPTLVEDVLRRARSLADLSRFALEPASETPLNGDLSPHRRIDWLTMPLDDVRELRGVLGCTVNDIVLATVTGALRRYFFRRRVDPAKLDFRVAAPVSVRKAHDERRQGNHVSTWIVRLPLGESDPIAQIDAVHERTEGLKRSQAALGADTVMKLAEWLPPAIIEAGVAIASGPANTIVTNVPGPQFPLYVVGAPMLGMYPMVPLIPGSGLGIALMSYDGKLCWGFNADYELVSDIKMLRDDVCAAFEELRRATVARFMERRTASAADAREIAVEGPETQGVAPDEDKPLPLAAEA